MNTNSKHYEELKVQPWEIMEKNFTNEEFVAYLKGNIIKYTLRDKGQALTDAEKIKHYAEKLIEVLETKENDKDNWTITGMKLEKPEPKKTLKTYKWYDASLYTVEELKELLPVGTIVLVTREEDNDREVDLEEEYTQEATVKRVDKRLFTDDTRIAINECSFYRRYFKIIE